MDEDDGIYDYERGKLGFMEDFKIYDSKDRLYYVLCKEDSEVRGHKGNKLFELKGTLEIFDNITFLGFCFAFLDIFC